MILEVAIMKIKPEEISNFEAAFPKAEAIISSIPGYISHEMQRCVETKGRYHFLIRWENIDAHMITPGNRRVPGNAKGILLRFLPSRPWLSISSASPAASCNPKRHRRESQRSCCRNRKFPRPVHQQGSGDRS